VPTVDGVVHSNPSVSPLEETNQIPDFAPTPSPKFIAKRPIQLPKLNPRPDLNNNNNNDDRASLPSARRFQNFAPRNNVQAPRRSEAQTPASTEQNTRVVNGRRAVLRKRVRPATQEAQPAVPVPSNRNSVNSQIIADEKVSREENLRERQRQLTQLEDQRAQLRRLQDAQQSGQPIRSESSRSFNFRPQQQQFQAQPIQQQPNFQPISDPFVSNFNGNSGTYTINY